MKKIKALIFNSMYSSSIIFAIIFSSISIIELIVGLFIPKTRSVMFTQSFLFMLIGCLSFINSNDQFFSFLLFPLSAKTILKAKLIQILTVLIFICMLFSLVLFFSHLYEPIHNLHVIFFIAAAIFPVIFVISFLWFCVILKGNIAATIMFSILLYGMPGICAGIISSISPRFYILIFEFFNGINTFLILAEIYLVCSVIIFLLYKLGLRNLKKLQHNAFFVIKRKQG